MKAPGPAGHSILETASGASSGMTLPGTCKPVVSVLIPVRNEEKHIGRALHSLLSQDFDGRIEILVIDGESTDGTIRLVEQIANKHGNIRVLRNVRNLPSFGLNLGVAHATGEYVIRADAHTLYSRSYVRECIQQLGREDVAVVGGVQRAVGVTYLGRSIAAALSHAFGVGNARFRYTTNELYCETVYLGAWRRATLLELGDFAEVNEDTEMCYRLRRTGRRVLVSPRIRLRYVARHSLCGLARQYAWYGRARMRTLVHHPDAWQWRQLAPPVLLAGLLLSAIAFPFSRYCALALPAVYLAADVVASSHVALRKGLKYWPGVLVAFPVMHISWAVGACAGMARFGVPWSSIRSLCSRAVGRCRSASSEIDPA